MIDRVSVLRYHAEDKKVWNEWVAHSPTATFLFNRNFMDYHADRFQDHSTLLFFENELVAVFPANEKGDTICSHSGLTYGGLALGVGFFNSSFFLYELEMLTPLLFYYKKKGFKTLIYKEIPFFYQPQKIFSIAPQQSEKFTETFAKISLIQEDAGAAIDLQQPIRFSYLRRRCIKKAQSIIPHFKIENTSFSDFWNELLIPQLKNKYNLVPTHTLSEIVLLASRFPENIKQYNVYFEEKIVAGVTVFEDKQVAHCQYIASNELGKKLYASDFLFHYLITEKYKHFRYFSFGISNEHGSNHINSGLLNWKKSWGAQVCKHLHFQVDF